MKAKLILLICINILVVRLVIAQQQAETWMLETQQPSHSSQHYQASKQVGLLPGFRSSPGSGHTFKADIDPYMILPGYTENITGGTDDNNQGGAVGTIPLTINVNEFGASQIDVPIHLPNGIASLTPELSFAYNSMSGDGILGVSWTIGGLSKISRVPKSYYYNGITGESGFDSDSQLAIDGVYLINAGNGIFYPEHQDFSVIKAFDASDINKGFKVIKSNGLVYEYGASENSRHRLQSLSQPVAWYISRITDAFGNYIGFSYNVNTNDGSICPDFIHYGGNELTTTDSKYEVKFNYYDFERYDTQKKYFSSSSGGSYYSQVTELLESIEVIYLPDDDRVIKYFLSYENGGILEKKLLNNIEPWHYESKSASTLNPVWIEWENSAYELSTKTIANGQQLNSFPEEIIQKGLLSAHFRDKNTSDLVHFGVNMSGPGRYINVYENRSRKYESGLYYNFANPISMSQNEAFVKMLAVCDSDGDGIDEIATVFRNGSTAQLTLIRVSFESYPNFRETVIRNIDGLGSLNSDDQILFSDFNGDGLTDLAFIVDNGVNDIFKGFFLSKPGLPFSEFIAGDLIDIGNIKKVFVGDFRGAGQNQILIITSNDTRLLFLNGTTEPGILSVPNDFSTLYNSGVFVSGDYNGDGKTDMLLLKDISNQNWIFYLGNGNGSFNDPVTVTNDPLAGISNERIIADLNNDGFIDVCHVNFEIVETGGYLYKRYYRTDYLIRADAGEGGIKIVKKEMKDAGGTRIPIDEVKMNTSNHWEHFHHCTGNFTGSSPSQIMFGRVYLNPAQPGVARLKTTASGPLYTPFVQAVRKITDGLGVITSFEYSPHTYQNMASEKESQAEKSREYSYPIQRFRGFMNVVAKLNAETFQKVYMPVTFNFYNPVSHSLGKGLLGFEITTRTDALTATISQNMYNFENDYYHRVLESSNIYTTIGSSPSLIQQTEYLTNFRNYPEFDFRIYYPYYATITKSFFERESLLAFKVEKTTMDIPDQYGNHQNITYEFGSSGRYPYKLTRSLAYDNFVYPNRRFIGLLRNEVNEYALADGGQVVNRTIDYINDPVTGYRTHKIIEQSDTKALTLTYTPDVFGNTVSVEASTSGYQSRITSTVFSDDGRFPVKVTNAEGHEKSFEYYPSNGRLKSETDENGGITQYFYDFFGDLKKTIHKDNTQTMKVKRWVLPSNPHPDTPEHGFPAYFTIVQTSGQSAVHTFFDQHNRPLRELSFSFSGDKIYKDFFYYEDNDYTTGLLMAETMPYLAGSGKPETINYEYDYLRRKHLTTNPNGSFEQSVYDGLTQQLTQFDGQTKEIINTEAGLVNQITDNGSNTLKYSYYGDGKVYKTTQAGLESTAVRYMYDAHRNLTAIEDPALGMITYDYNAFGDLVLKWDINDQTHYTYDKLGRLIQRTASDGIALFTWDGQPNGIGLPATTDYQPSSAHSPAVREYFEYDQLARPSRIKQVVDGAELAFTYTWDVFGRRKTITYPSGFMLTNMYDENGSLRAIVNQAGKKLWVFNASDALNKITNYSLGEDIIVNNTYSSADGLIRNISAQSDKSEHLLLDLEYDWYSNGNLMYRRDLNRSLTESFYYDNFNRLAAVSFNQGSPTVVASYKANGNIGQKLDAGTFYYAIPSRPYAVSKIIPVQGSFPQNDQMISYTAFNKPASITEGNYMLTLQYGSNHERVYQSKVNIATAARQQTRFFTPLYEVVEDEGKQKLIHYLSAPSGLYAIFTIENGNNGRMNYVLKDHQGSLAALVNEKGSAEYFSFDAWGRRRNAQSWTYENMPASFGSTRGFTMHEHLDEFKLINMNGRVYDPLVGRFLSPDPFVQMPNYSQSYNRYSYAFNNPLRFSDPSGFFAEGDSTVRSSTTLPFLPSKKPVGYRPGATTNTDITSLGPVFKETETTLPIPYLQSKLSNDAEGNASEVATNSGSAAWDLNGDSRMTFNESFNWWKNGGGTTAMVPLSSLDLGSITSASFKDGVGSVKTFNLLLLGNATDGVVHGTISLRLYPNNTVKAFDGPYDFDYKPWLTNPIRNIENFFGKIKHGAGTPYEIDFTGSATIRPNLSITNWYIRTGGMR